MADMLFKNGRVYTWDKEKPYLANGYIWVSGHHIKGMGNMQDLPADIPAGADTVDLKGQVVMPGMVCAHSHFYGQLIRGVPMAISPANWQQILGQMWWVVDKALTPEMNRASAILGLMDGLKNGTTTYFDHHASPANCDGSLDILAEEAGRFGARVCLSYEVSDRNGPASAKQGVAENVRFGKKTAAYGDDAPVRAMFGLHASYTLGDDTLALCRQENQALGLGYHIHVAEDKADVSESYRLCDKHVVDRLDAFGILGEKSIAAHCVHVGPQQWATFAQNGTTVAHNVQSNTNNAVGTSPVWPMLQQGVHVALGGDGYNYDLFAELNIASMLQKLNAGDPRVMGGPLFDDFVFHNNFRLGQTVFGPRFGCLKAGNLADFVTLGYVEPTPLMPGNFYGHALSGAFSRTVCNVVVNGRLALRGGQLVGIDEERERAFCRKAAQQLWDAVC